MKKIILTLLAAIAALSVDAQIIEVYRITQQTNPEQTIETLEAVYDQNYKVKFKAKKVFTSEDDGYSEPTSDKLGTCNKTVNSSTTPQNWVQLWPNGPKFADEAITGISNYNVGTDMVKSTWGPNWRDPSEAEILTMVSKCTISYDSTTEKFTITGTGTNAKSITLNQSAAKKLYLWTSFCETDNSSITKRLALYIENSGGANSIRIVPYNVTVGSASILPVLNE